MKFYAIKPKSAEIDERISVGMLSIVPQAAAVPSLEECDIAIL